MLSQRSTAGAVAIPILPGGLPDWNRRLEGYTANVGQGGLAIEFPAASDLPGRQLVVGVEVPSGDMQFAVVDVRHRTPMPTGVRVGVSWTTEEHDLLRRENLAPHLDRQTLQFGTRLPEEVLFAWGSLGVVRPRLEDYVFVCPECRSLPTFRDGCRRCTSARLASCQLVHHFACAHVGYVAEFEKEGVLVCPKCRSRQLVVGADFEYLSGPFTCLDCQWSDTELEHIGQCLSCGSRFPRWRAAELELIGYHVQRLDPLALLPAS